MQPLAAVGGAAFFQDGVFGVERGAQCAFVRREVQPAAFFVAFEVVNDGVGEQVHARAGQRREEDGFCLAVRAELDARCLAAQVDFVVNAQGGDVGGVDAF